MTHSDEESEQLLGKKTSVCSVCSTLQKSEGIRSSFPSRISRKGRLIERGLLNGMSSIRKMLKKFDMNPSTEDSFKVRTLSGAFSRDCVVASPLVSVVTVCIMGALFWGEFKLYIHNVIVDGATVTDRSVWRTWSSTRRRRPKRTFRCRLISHCIVLATLGHIIAFPADSSKWVIAMRSATTVWTSKTRFTKRVWT